MPTRQPAAEFYDPRVGMPALSIGRWSTDRAPLEPPRSNRFAVYAIESGRGTVDVDAGCHSFAAGSLLFVVPYQHVRFVPERRAGGEVIEFHANFLCVETFHAEAGCSGLLFNDPYGVPVLPLDESAVSEVAELFARIVREQQEQGKAHADVSLAYLKVLLILAARAKGAGDGACATSAADRHPTVSQLRTLIEERYRTWHAPAEYAKALHMTAKTLGRLVSETLGITLTELIRRRILTHAKWQLLHTLRPVKEIAGELGFADELYFSRMFKKAVGVSPTYFREFETEIRGGSNLSISLSRTSILPPPQAADH
jgi:AraC family transcriptional activator of pobA